MQQKSLVSYNFGLAGHPRFVFAVVNVYLATTILVWHGTICISCGLYLGIHWCTGASLTPSLCGARILCIILAVCVQTPAKQGWFKNRSNIGPKIHG